MRLISTIFLGFGSSAGAGGSLFGMGLLVLLLLLLPCCPLEGAQQKKEPPDRTLVWPPAPDEPRVGYVRSLARPADWGPGRSFLSRLGRWIIGEGQGVDMLVKPFGIAVDEMDNLCLTDTGTATVWFFDRGKKKHRKWEKAGDIRFASPVAVARQRGLFYVADSGLGQVIVFDEGGKLRGRITQHLERPSGLAFSGDSLFVTDSQRHVLVVFDRAGKFLRQIGGRGSAPGQFNFPTHVAADRQGNLYVTDAMNNRVQILDPEGRPKGQVGSIGDTPGHFGRPKGVAVDSLDHVYVADALFDNIQIFNARGQVLMDLGKAGNEPGEFWLPNGVATSSQNEIFVADTYNRRVQIFKYLRKE